MIVLEGFRGCARVDSNHRPHAPEGTARLRLNAVCLNFNDLRDRGFSGVELDSGRFGTGIGTASGTRDEFWPVIWRGRYSLTDGITAGRSLPRATAGE